MHDPLGPEVAHGPELQCMVNNKKGTKAADTTSAKTTIAESGIQKSCMAFGENIRL